MRRVIIILNDTIAVELDGRSWPKYHALAGAIYLPQNQGFIVLGCPRWAPNHHSHR